MKKSRLTKIDKDIFASLAKAKRPLPVKRIAKRVDISWPTAKQHVKKLEKMGVVKTNKTIRRTNVSITDDLKREIKRLRRSTRRW